MESLRPSNADEREVYTACSTMLHIMLINGLDSIILRLQISLLDLYNSAYSGLSYVGEGSDEGSITPPPPPEASVS